MKGKRLSFSKEQIAFMKKFYRKFAPKYVTEGLNECFNLDLTESRVRSFMHNHGIRSGRNYCFPKGHIPWNSGTKGMGICKGNSGNFKKGSIPPNRKPLWSERIDSKDGYIIIKVPLRDPYTGFSTRYMPKHVYLYEKKHGKIPKGFKLVFKDGNRLNCKLRNLALVSDAELLEMNRQKFGDAPIELKETIMVLSKLRVKAVTLTRRKRKV